MTGCKSGTENVHYRCIKIVFTHNYLLYDTRTQSRMLTRMLAHMLAHTHRLYGCCL